MQKKKNFNVTETQKLISPLLIFCVSLFAYLSAIPAFYSKITMYSTCLNPFSLTCFPILDE